MWAWGVGRVRKLTAVGRLAVILPFEEPFFRARGVPASFVGHPLRDRAPAPPRAEARRALGLDPGRPVLGLFPGSRPQEVVRLWPVFRDTAGAVLAAHPATQVVVAGTPRGRYVGPGAIRIHMGDPLPVFAAADAGLCKSGTTTLEAALVDLPMVIAYRLNPVSFAIAIRLLRVPHVGLVNLIAERQVAPEFLQGAATPRRGATVCADGSTWQPRTACAGRSCMSCGTAVSCRCSIRVAARDWRCSSVATRTAAISRSCRSAGDIASSEDRPSAAATW